MGVSRRADAHAADTDAFRIRDRRHIVGHAQAREQCAEFAVLRDHFRPGHLFAGPHREGGRSMHRPWSINRPRGRGIEAEGFEIPHRRVEIQRCRQRD